MFLALLRMGPEGRPVWIVKRARWRLTAGGAGCDEAGPWCGIRLHDEPSMKTWAGTRKILPAWLFATRNPERRGCRVEP